MITRGYDGTSAVDELLDFAERSVFGSAQGKLDRSFTPVNQIIKESLDLVDRLSKRKEHVTGVPTGYIDLDDLTAGLQPSDLVVIAGRPSMGKTSLALGMASTPRSIAEPSLGFSASKCQSRNSCSAC